MQKQGDWRERILFGNFEGSNVNFMSCKGEVCAWKKKVRFLKKKDGQI